MLFLVKRQKNVLNQNLQNGGFLFSGNALNDESNGTNPPSVSFLCVEKLTKQFQKIQKFLSIFSIFSIFKTFQEIQYCIFMCKYIQLNVISVLLKCILMCKYIQ